MESEKRGFNVKTSFRKFIVNTSRNNPTWSEMAMGTRLDTKWGGLPTNQGLCNVVSLAANSDSDRALLFKWLLNDGLYQAVQARNNLTEWAIEQLDYEVPIHTQGLPEPAVGGLRKAVGESVQYKEALRSSEEPAPPRIHKYEDQIINPLDLFSPTMRKKIPELGQHADEIDAKWKTDFEDKLAIPIFRNGKAKGSIQLANLNAILESKGYEGFHYGPHITSSGKWSGGYLQSVEKGDWLQPGQQAHWSDKGQRHGPDLSQAEMVEDDKGRAFYVFDNMATPQDEYALRRKAAVMKQRFVNLVKDVGQGKSDISDMHQQIAQRVKAGDFEKMQWTPSKPNQYAKDKFGVDARTAQSEAVYPTEVIKDIIPLVQAGLKGPFKVANLEDKLAGVPPEIVSDMIIKREGDNFWMSDKFQKMAFDFIFQHVDINDLDSQEEWQLMPKNKWKSFLDKSGTFNKEKKWTSPWTDLFFTLSSTISNGTQSHPELMTPAINFSIRKGVLPIEDIAKQNELEHRELTPQGLAGLVNQGYRINGQSIPNDIQEIMSMLDSHGHSKLLAKKGDHVVELRKEKDGKYYAVFQSSGDNPFGDLGEPDGHMAAGLQMPVSMGQGRMGIFPTGTSEEQDDFEEKLMRGDFGEGDAVGNVTELQCVKTAVGAAIKQYKNSGHQRGTVSDAKGNKSRGAASEADIDDIFGGFNGILGMGAEALKALGGHYAMKYGFITDEQYKQNTKFDAADELNKIDGGRTFSANLEETMDRVGVDIDDVAPIVDRVWKTIQRGDGPKPEDFRDYIEQFGKNFWAAVKHALNSNAKAGRTRLIKNYIFNKMEKMKQSQVNQGGVNALNVVDDAEGRGDALGGGKTFKSVDPFGGRVMLLDDDNFVFLKKFGAKLYGKEPLPESLDELKALIDADANGTVSVSSVIQMKPEELKNYLKDKSDIEHLSKLSGIKFKLYLYKGLRERDDVSYIDQETTEEAYLMKATRPDDLGKGQDQRKVDLKTGFAKPDDFGKRVKDFKAGTGVGGPDVKPATKPATAASQPQAPSTWAAPKIKPSAEVPAQTPQPQQGVWSAPKIKKFGEATLPSYKIWKETSVVYDPKMKNPKKGSGFNWWGTPGNAGGTEIGGEVETMKNDPDGTKGVKSGKRKRG